jgi:hypothetical protein
MGRVILLIVVFSCIVGVGFYLTYDHGRAEKRLVIDPDAAAADYKKARELVSSSEAYDAMEIISRYLSAVDDEHPVDPRWVSLAIDACEQVGDPFNLAGLYYLYPEAFTDREEACLILAEMSVFTKDDEGFEEIRALWRGREQQDRHTIRRYRQQVYQQYPTSRYAAEAYFTLFSYSDYLQGADEAMDHLKNMKNVFPSSPFLVNAYYLVGLDLKRDKADVDGNIVRHKELNAAIDALEQAKSTFDRQYEENVIAAENLEYFATVRYRAQLEAATTNLAIAEESQGAKRQIYLEYAENAFDTILQEFDDASYAPAQALQKTESFSGIKEEAQYGLAQSNIRAKNDVAAERILTQMLEVYAAEKINRGYLISRIWYDLGGISMRREEYDLALQFLHHAQEAAKGGVLSAEQRLDLWIQQALCYRANGDLDSAMIVLSKVINDDTVSSQRLKAMVLRAEIYEEQGRTELAVKQLEATAKKGGPWAAKAQEKLVNDYGFR